MSELGSFPHAGCVCVCVESILKDEQSHKALGEVNRKFCSSTNRLIELKLSETSPKLDFVGCILNFAVAPSLLGIKLEQ